ncbi:hypothetical protein D5086_023948 [Populus alba]|uniref:Uncharacterized protein n=1 Tax=Populus alba TaxID=43335 RepID=A0ACC4B447_POPAL
MSLGLVNVTAFRVQIEEVDEDNWSGSEVVEEDLDVEGSYRNLAPLDLTGQPNSELAQARFANSSSSS